MLARTIRFRPTTALFALALLGGCNSDEGPNDSVPEDWFAYFRLTENDESHLYIRDGWQYGVVPGMPARSLVLPIEHQNTIANLFSNGLDDYESDSMSTPGADMGECDASAAHPVVHRVLINPDPIVGRPGFGCWSTTEELGENTRMMVERMEAIIDSLADRGEGDGSGNDSGM